MEEIDETESYWLHELEDELSKDLEVSEAVAPQESTTMNKLISNIYSGPTINDIENALASSYRSRSSVEGINKIQPVMSVSEKGYGKIENKYTIRIQSSGNGPADDGYRWRKYGQKTIKNSPNPSLLDKKNEADEQFEIYRNLIPEEYPQRGFINEVILAAKTESREKLQKDFEAEFSNKK